MKYQVDRAVARGYFIGNGEIDASTVLDDDHYAWFASMDDTFLKFLLAETGGDGVREDDGSAPDSPEHWAVALRRMRTIQREVESVIKYLRAAAPTAVLVEDNA